MTRRSFARTRLATAMMAVTMLSATAPVRSGPSVPTFSALDAGPPVLLSNADGTNPYSGIVRYQGRVACTGVFLDTIPERRDPGRAPAYALTNGHCSDFPGPNEVLPIRPAPAGHRVVFNYFADTRDQQFPIAVARIVYATMKGQDVAVLELDARYGDLVARGFQPWRPALTLPERDEPVVLVGAPLQSDPRSAYLRLASCRVAGRAPLVLEFQWHWYAFDRNTCAGIQPGSSGSPVISRVTGRVVGLANTTTSGGRLAYTECTLDHPCEPSSGSAISYANTSYATPVVRIDRCFDSAGWFDLSGVGCSLDAGLQARVTPNVLGAVNPTLKAIPVGRPVTQWNVTVSGPFEFYRYKAASVPEQDCRDLRGYGPARRVSERPLIDDPLPARDGWYFLCVLGGQQSRWGAQWQSVDEPTVVSASIDTVPPRIPAPLTVDESDFAWRISFVTFDPEVSFYVFKFGRPADTRCADAVDYRPALIPFTSLPKSGRPYVLCAIPFDRASNPGPILERMLP